MAELKDEVRTLYDSTALPTYSVAATPSGSRSRGNELTRSRGRGCYANGRRKRLEVCFHFHIQKHSEPTYWKKYPEKSPKSQKKEEKQKKTDSSR